MPRITWIVSPDDLPIAAAPSIACEEPFVLVLPAAIRPLPQGISAYTDEWVAFITADEDQGQSSSPATVVPLPPRILLDTDELVVFVAPSFAPSEDYLFGLPLYAKAPVTWLPTDWVFNFVLNEPYTLVRVVAPGTFLYAESIQATLSAESISATLYAEGLL